jgi:GT2 family glycosyltransferase
MTDPLIIIVILNTNRREDTLDCLASLVQSSYANYKIMVLDNASTDGSAAAIQRAYPQVEVVALAENKGYAGNNNVGIAAALAQGADWVLVLNEDTILDPDCLSQLTAVGESAADIGIVGPLVYHFNEPTIIQSAGGAMDGKLAAWHTAENEPDQGQFSTVRPVEWIHGCAIMIRRDVIAQLGMFDERFFYYWEETEICLRARRGGWRILFVPAAKLWHKGVQRDYNPSPNVTYYNTRNRLLMLARHKAPAKARLYAWGQIARTLTSWSVKPRWRHMRAHRDAMWQGVQDYRRGRWGKRP